MSRDREIALLASFDRRVRQHPHQTRQPVVTGVEILCTREFFRSTRRSFHSGVLLRPPSSGCETRCFVNSSDAFAEGFSITPETSCCGARVRADFGCALRSSRNGNGPGGTRKLGEPPSNGRVPNPILAGAIWCRFSAFFSGVWVRKFESSQQMFHGARATAHSSRLRGIFGILEPNLHYFRESPASVESLLVELVAAGGRLRRSRPSVIGRTGAFCQKPREVCEILFSQLEICRPE